MNGYLLIELLQHHKSLVLDSEELSAEFLSFLPPLKEQRDVLEHVSRVLAMQCGLLELDAEEVEDNLNKAISHAIRDFYDQAEFIGLNLREKIQNIFSSYSNEVIAIAFPKYYKIISPKLEKINRKLSKIRQEKDSAKLNKDINKIKSCKEAIFDLWELYEEAITIVPLLEDTKRKRRNENWIKNLLYPILCTIVGGLIVGFVMYSCDKSS